jgi:hypothetical protein
LQFACFRHLPAGADARLVQRAAEIKRLHPAVQKDALLDIGREVVISEHRPQIGRQRKRLGCCKIQPASSAVKL